MYSLGLTECLYSLHMHEEVQLAHFQSGIHCIVLKLAHIAQYAQYYNVYYIIHFI